MPVRHFREGFAKKQEQKMRLLSHFILNSNYLKIVQIC